MSQTLSLYRLQQVDNQIDRINTRLQAIQKTLEDDAELRLAKELTASALAESQSADNAMKQAESDAQKQRIKIEQTESSLYTGKGHSPKELLDLENDVAALKRHLLTLEDIQLDSMVSAENTGITYQTALVDLQTVQNKSKEQNLCLLEEQAALQKELEKLFSERAATVGPVPADAIRLYDNLREQRRGIAVAVISENSCSACGSGLSAAQMQSSRAMGQMAFCPSCGRILYGN